MTQQFNGEVALITGASQGIGTQVARTFHRAGATVVINHLGTPGTTVDAQALADELNLLRTGLIEKLGRDIGHAVVAHLADNWPKDRASRGFLSVLDANLCVVANIAGTPPVYDDAGHLRPMRHQEDVFLHPHDLLVDDDDSLYVAQFASNQTYPIKLERV